MKCHICLKELKKHDVNHLKCCDKQFNKKETRFNFIKFNVKHPEMLTKEILLKIPKEDSYALAYEMNFGSDT